MKNKSFKGTIAAFLLCLSCVSFCSCGNTADNVNVISSDMETITETYNSFKKSKERTEKIDLYKSMKTVSKGKLSKSEQKQYSTFLIDMNDYFINDYNKTLIQVEMVINEQGELGKNQDKELVNEQYAILTDFEKQVVNDGICTDEQIKDYKSKISDLNIRLQSIQKNSGIIDADKTKKDIITLPIVTGVNNYEGRSNDSKTTTSATTKATTSTTKATASTTKAVTTTKVTVASSESDSTAQAHSSSGSNASEEPQVTEPPNQDSSPSQPSENPASPSDVQTPDADPENNDDTQSE